MKTFNSVFGVAAIALSAMLSTNLMAASSSALNIGGFIDAQARWKKVDPEASNTAVDGFIVGDGALYLSKEVGTTRFMLDLPFAYDDNTTTNTSTNSFKFGRDKAQGYVAWNYNDGLFGFQLGQFDSPIGYESNDSIDNFLPDNGLTMGGFVPTTHTGLMLMTSRKVDFGTVTVKGLVSNQANNGKKGGNNFETAAQVRLDHDAFYGAASYLYSKQASADIKHQMIDFTVGGKLMNRVKVDAEVTLGKDGRAATASGTGDKWGQGYQVNASMDATNAVAIGGRVDYLSKMPSNYKAMQLSAGPAYKVNDAMTLKADYSYRSVEATEGATKIKTNYINVAGQFRF